MSVPVPFVRRPNNPLQTDVSPPGSLRKVMFDKANAAELGAFGQIGGSSVAMGFLFVLTMEKNAMTDEDKPSIHHAEEELPFKPNRIVPLVLAVVSGGFVAFNHYQAINDGKVNLWILFIGPLFCLLGIGGVIDPRIAWSFGPKGQNFPAKIKIIGGLLVVVGLAISAYLALGVYRLQEVRTNNPPENSTDSGTPR